MMKKIKKLIKIICSTPLLFVDWWALKKKICVKHGFIRDIYIRAFEKKLSRQGSWIGWNAQIKNIPCFPHGVVGVFISGSAKIGANAVIFHQVTIGSNTLIDSKGIGAPIIGDNCYIGAGAKIIGNVTIGDNCRIGANAVVVKDVPDNSIVVIEGMKVIHKENMDNKYYIKTLSGDMIYYENDKFIKKES